jgi:hypothetical protein
MKQEFDRILETCYILGAIRFAARFPGKKLDKTKMNAYAKLSLPESRQIVDYVIGVKGKYPAHIKIKGDAFRILALGND